MSRAALALMLALLCVPCAVQAQATQDSSQQASPGEQGPASAWTTRREPAGSAADSEEEKPPLDERPPIVLTREQIELLGKINDYLNSLVNLEGRFVQTDHRNEETRGKFYVSRPGKLRFDYSAPSKLRIVSDGEYLSVEDHDLKTVDKFPLDATPIQLLLGEDVDLLRDAVILDMKQDENAVVVVLRDKSGNSPGTLQLFFKRPDLELYEWVITDAQGLDTRIQLADLVLGNEKSDDFFTSSSIALDNVFNR